jgi:GNAT superfamily N-acetyltransferase
MVTNTPSEPHWYLNLLATHPDWQRQGLGSALMDVMFERADADGLPCYLETETPENVAYYMHHGFEVRTEWDVPSDGPQMWGLLRKPVS